MRLHYAVLVLLGIALAMHASWASGSSMSCPITGTLVSNNDFGVCIAGAIPLSLIGLLLSFLLVGFSYMIGNVFQISSFKNWYQGELWETAKTALLIITIFAILIIASGIAVILTGSNTQISTLTASSTGVQNALNNNLGALYSADLNDYINPSVSTMNESYYAFEGLSIGVGDLKSTVISTWIPIPIPFVGSLQFGSSATVLVSSVIESNLASPTFSFIKDFITILLIPVDIVLQAMQQFFYYIVLIALALFIPLGMVMRAIPFLRGIGGTFIAFGIAIGLIFPILLVTFNVPIINYIQPALYPASPPTVSYVCPSVSITHLFSDILCSVGTALYGSPSNYLISAQTLNPAYTSAFDYGLNSGTGTIFGSNGKGSIYSDFNVVGYYGSPIILQFILLIFDLVITLVIAGAVAQMLGGKLSLGIGKFKIA